jgi:hypothetical protein
MENEVPMWIKQMLPELKEISANKFKIIGRYAGDCAKDLTYWCQKRGDWDAKVIYEKGNRIIVINEDICNVLNPVGLRRMRA